LGQITQFDFTAEIRIHSHDSREVTYSSSSPEFIFQSFSLDPPFSVSDLLPSSMRVLVVEDDAKIASFVVRGLKQAGYAVDHAPDGETGLALAESTDYDVAIVDVMLPQLDGISLVKRLRAARRPLPVLFLSAKSAVDDRVRGLQAGGDDYLTKPFAFSELVARVQALIRRATSSPESTRLVSGDVTLDLVSREVTCAGQPIELQPREFSLLAFLLRHAGRPISKTMILEHVWDYSFDPQTNVVDVVMSRLRAKIDPDHKRIETVRGVGYIFRPHGHA
jgi:two-component system, OmpR family, response regulator